MPCPCLNFLNFRNPRGGGKYKEVVSDLKTLGHKGCKIAGKKLVSQRFFSYKQDFFGIAASIRIGREILCQSCAGFLLYDRHICYEGYWTFKEP